MFKTHSDGKIDRNFQGMGWDRRVRKGRNERPPAGNWLEASAYEGGPTHDVGKAGRGFG